MKRLLLLLFLISVVVFQTGNLVAGAPDKQSNCSYQAAVCFENATTDDPPGTIDPALNKDAGCTTVTLTPNRKEIQVFILNAYPGYRPQITATVRNCGEVPIYLCGVTAESSEAVWIDYQFTDGQKLLPGETMDCSITAGIYQAALENQQYGFRLMLSFCQLFVGSPGFWGHIDRNRLFSPQQVEEWLCLIDDSSAFLGPRTVEEMLTFFNNKDRSPEVRFLKHYLAMRLDVCAGLLELNETHDVTSIDTGNYLGLANPESATLAEIIEAMESKYGTGITRKQYLLMKTICDEIYHYHI